MLAVDTVESRLAALRDRAKSLHQQRRFAESLAAHEEALRLAPDSMVIRLSAARLAHSLELQEVSLRHYEDAVRVDPRCYEAVEAARRICVGAGFAERALKYASMARALNPSPAADLSTTLLVPSIASSLDAIREARERYEHGLDAMLAEPPHLEWPDGSLGVSAFFLAYHGLNDRELQIKTARLFLAAIPGLAFTAPHCAGARRSGAKIRIGFISRFFAAHSIFSTSVGLIEQLSRERFEVVALRVTPSRDDEATSRIRAAADRTGPRVAPLHRVAVRQQRAERRRQPDAQQNP